MAVEPLHSRLALPTLVVSGAEDSTTPFSTFECELIPALGNGRLVVLGGAGHLLPFETGPEIARLIETLIATPVSQTRGRP